MNAEMENHEEQRDIQTAGKKEKMAQQRQKKYTEKRNVR